jgi:DNA-binding CsgD family transcriptional regulator
MAAPSARAELASALLEGAFETPLWHGFLQKLRTATGADHATLIFRPPGKPLDEALHLYSGALGHHRTERVYGEYLTSLELLSDFGMDEEQLCSFDQIYPPTDAKHDRFYREVVLPSGITAARVIKVTEKTGVAAWLTVSRLGEDFGAAEDLILRDIAPILRGALRNYVALERERFTAAVTGDAMRRLYFAWMTLDARGHVLDHDHEVDKVFSPTGVMSKGPGGRLIVKPAKLERDIHEAIRDLATNPQAKARVFTLNWDPWLDILLIPAAHKRLSIDPSAAVIAYLHGDSWRANDRCDQLTQLFGLSPSEARLALALSRGMSIEEAATEFGLKIGSARKYSKLIYAKTGARGMPDLVRIVMRSVLALADR